MKKIHATALLLAALAMLTGAMGYSFIDASQLTGTIAAARLPASIPQLNINADQITGGNLSTNRLPATISTTNAVSVGGVNHLLPSYLKNSTNITWNTSETNAVYPVLSLASPPAIGGTTPAAGAFTTLTTTYSAGNTFGGQVGNAAYYSGTPSADVAFLESASGTLPAGTSGLVRIEVTTFTQNLWYGVKNAAGGVPNYYGSYTRLYDNVVGAGIVFVPFTLTSAVTATNIACVGSFNPAGNTVANITVLYGGNAINYGLAKFSGEIMLMSTPATAAGGTALYRNDTTGSLQYNSSSIRYKQNVETLGADWDRFMKIRPVSFEPKSDLGKTNLGMISEELRVLYRDQVFMEDNRCGGIHYEQMIAPTIACTQDLKKELEDLKREIRRLKQARK